MKIILGSQSPWRKKILTDAGYDFKVVIPDIDEKAIRSENYEELPLLLARAKAKALLERIHEPAILITSDQIVVCNGELREKPESTEEAHRFLESYGKFPTQTNTGVVVTNTKTGKQAEGLDIAKVFFKPIPPDMINEIIAEGSIFTAAGGFRTELPLIAPYVDHREGEITGIQGLPLPLTQRLMENVA